MIGVEDVARQECEESVVDRLLDETGDLVPACDLVGPQRRTALVGEPVGNVRPGDQPPVRKEGLGAASQSLCGGSQRPRVVGLRHGPPALRDPEPVLVR